MEKVSKYRDHSLISSKKMDMASLSVDGSNKATIYVGRGNNYHPSPLGIFADIVDTVRQQPSFKQESKHFIEWIHANKVKLYMTCLGNNSSFISVCLFQGLIDVRTWLSDGSSTKWKIVIPTKNDVTITYLNQVSLEDIELSNFVIQIGYSDSTSSYFEFPSSRGQPRHKTPLEIISYSHLDGCAVTIYPQKDTSLIRYSPQDYINEKVENGSATATQWPNVIKVQGSYVLIGTWKPLRIEGKPSTICLNNNEFTLVYVDHGKISKVLKCHISGCIPPISVEIPSLTGIIGLISSSFDTTIKVIHSQLKMGSIGPTEVKSEELTEKIAHTSLIFSGTDIYIPTHGIFKYDELTGLLNLIGEIPDKIIPKLATIVRITKDYTYLTTSTVSL